MRYRIINNIEIYKLIFKVLIIMIWFGLIAFIGGAILFPLLYTIPTFVMTSFVTLEIIYIFVYIIKNILENITIVKEEE